MIQRQSPVRKEGSTPDRSNLLEFPIREPARGQTDTPSVASLSIFKFLLAAAAPFFVLIGIGAVTSLPGWARWLLFGAAALWFLFVIGLMFVALAVLLGRSSGARD